MTAAGPHKPHCPFCLSVILPVEDRVVCSACGIPHHRECWRINGRCTTYGCTGRAVHVAPGTAAPPPERPDAAASAGDADDNVLEVSIPSPRGSLSPVWVVLLIVTLPLLMTLALSYTPRQAPDPPPAPLPMEGRLQAPLPAAKGQNERVVTQRCALEYPRTDADSKPVELWPGDSVELLGTAGHLAYVRTETGAEGYVPRTALAAVKMR